MKNVWMTERPGPDRLYAGTALAVARAHRIIRVHRNGDHKSSPPRSRAASSPAPAPERRFAGRLYLPPSD